MITDTDCVLDTLIVIETHRFPWQVSIKPSIWGWYSVWDKIDGHYLGLVRMGEIARLVFRGWRSNNT